MTIRPLLESSSRVLFLGHQNADPDAICSMAALAELYGQLNRQGHADLVCDDVSRLAVQVLEKFSPMTKVSASVEGDHDLVVVVDANNRFQFGERLQSFQSIPSKTVVIDHHEPNPDIAQLAEHSIVKSDASSTCEIVIELYDEFDIPISPTAASLLLAGIVFDTRRFFYASRGTLDCAVRLLRAGADYQAVINSLVSKPDRSERIARLKAAARLRFQIIDDWIIVTTSVGAFEASACRSLIELGADVAIVGGSPSKGVVRLSSRSTNEFYAQTGVNLGRDVMEPLGEVIEGIGGGHPNAAGANGKRNRDKALAVSVELIREALAKKLPHPDEVTS